MKLRKRDDRYRLGGASGSLTAKTNTFKTFLQTLKTFLTLGGYFYHE